MTTKYAPPSQSGNMLIYILGAIFLLGILIIATKGNYQPGAGIDQEGVTLKVAQVRRYAAELERGVNYIMHNGQSETAIRFSHANAISAYGTYGTNPKAEVFNPLGGGVEWRDPPTGIQATVTPWHFSGRTQADEIGSTCLPGNKDPCLDLIAFLPDVTKAFCIAVNNSVGITNPSGNPPQETSNLSLLHAFAGSFAYSTDLNVTGSYTRGRPEGCFEGNTGTFPTGATAGHWYYYKVLMAR